MLAAYVRQEEFQSTLPIQGETLSKYLFWILISFQSTLPIQGETAFLVSIITRAIISIHSPYTGRDHSRM